MKLNEAIEVQIDESLSSLVNKGQAKGFLPRPTITFLGMETFTVPKWFYVLKDVEIFGLSGWQLSAFGGVLGKLLWSIVHPEIKNTMIGAKYPELKRIIRDSRAVGYIRDEEEYRKKTKSIMDRIVIVMDKINSDQSVPPGDRRKLYDALSRVMSELQYAQAAHNIFKK